jgi:hypothetical protein
LKPSLLASLVSHVSNGNTGEYTQDNTATILYSGTKYSEKDPYGFSNKLAIAKANRKQSNNQDAKGFVGG